MISLSESDTQYEGHNYFQRIQSIITGLDKSLSLTYFNFSIVDSVSISQVKCGCILRVVLLHTDRSSLETSSDHLL